MESSILNKAETSADVDLSIAKVVSFIVATVLSAGVAGYFIAQVNFAYGLIALVLFWILFILQVFFIKDWSRILITTSLESIAMILPGAWIFRDNFSAFVFFAFGVLFSLLLLAEHSGRSELANSLKIPLWRTVSRVASRVISTTFVFIVIFYLFVAGRSIVAKEGVQLVNDSIITPMVRVVLPDFSSNMSFDAIIMKIIERQIGEQALKNLPAAAKAEALRNAKQSIVGYIGDINTKVPIGTAIYDYFAERLTSSSTVVRVSISLILVVMLLGLVKGTTLFLFFPVAALAALAYEIAIVSNFAVIQYESRSREIILLK